MSEAGVLAAPAEPAGERAPNIFDEVTRVIFEEIHVARWNELPQHLKRDWTAAVTHGLTVFLAAQKLARDAAPGRGRSPG